MKYTSRLGWFPFLLVCGITSTCFAQSTSPAGAPEVDQIEASYLADAGSIDFHSTPHDLTNGQAHSRFGIFGIDSIPNFNRHFFVDGFDFAGNPNRHWYTDTVGNPPQMGGTTLINAPIQPVNVALDDKDGHPRFINGNPLVSDATQFVAPVLGSPVFSTSAYSSGADATQFSDAIQRAEYFDNMKPDWHTLLGPDPKPVVTMHVRQAANCPTGPNFAGCNYVLQLNGDGTCCRRILMNIGAFVQAFFGVVVNDIVHNTITTKDISSFLFPNVFLFGKDTTQCCVLGFHTYFFDPSSDPESRWVVNYSSWISSGLFKRFVDVTGLSHEIAEIYNDPFVVSDGVHNLTPWWKAPNGNCQDNLETGDVIEGLPNSEFPVTMNNGVTYHPQNEALLQWFEFQSPSDALGGAYSYPDTTVLTAPSLPQIAHCK